MLDKTLDNRWHSMNAPLRLWAMIAAEFWVLIFIFRNKGGF